MNAWVLWSDYSDGGTEIVRVYLTETRAKADFTLVANETSVRRWHLKEVPIMDVPEEKT